jgi:uncharacterized membrane protein
MVKELRLVIPSAVAIFLLAVRVFWSERTEFSFLLWNLVLAWVPLALSAIIARRHDARARLVALVPLFALWLGFLPNAPYIVTDFMHLTPREEAPLWFDALMLASFAWAGVTLGTASLATCARVVRERFGAMPSHAFVAVTIVLTAFGIYLGRFVRLNTWDVLVHPFSVARNVVAPVAHPATHMRAWTFTPIFAAFFFASYLCTGTSAASFSLTKARA